MESRSAAGLFEAFPDGVALLDVETGTVLRANDRCADLSGHATEVLEGASLASLSPAEWTPQTPVDTLLERAREGRVTFDWRIERADGTAVDLQCAMRRIDDSEVLVTVREQTDDVDAEESALRGHEEHQELLEGMNDAVMVVDMAGNFVDVNRTVIERLGYTRAELLAMGTQDVSPPEQAAKVAERIRKIDETERLVFESVQVTEDGEEIPVEINASKITYRGEQAVLSVARDISDRKQRQRRLRTFEQAIEQTGHAVYITDTDGTIEYVNPAFEAMTGYDAETAVGETPSILSAGER
jgi:PAS domain S-box-containing protein